MPARRTRSLLALFALAAATAEGAALVFPEGLLKGEHRRTVKEVVEDSTLHRQMSGLRLAGRQAVFEHLVTHPDFAASLAWAAGVLKYSVDRRGAAEYWADDHRGLSGRLEILQASEGQIVLYAEGTYHKGILRIPGRLAMVMQSVEGRDGDSLFVENTVSAYVRVDSAPLDPVVRLFRPLVDRLMERRVHWFFQKANRLMARLYHDPEAVLQKLPPEAWQEEAAQLRVLLEVRPSERARAGPQTWNDPRLSEMSPAVTALRTVSARAPESVMLVSARRCRYRLRSCCSSSSVHVSGVSAPSALINSATASASVAGTYPDGLRADRGGAPRSSFAKADPKWEG
jgi:hypothetical protein